MYILKITSRKELSPIIYYKTSFGISTNIKKARVYKNKDDLKHDFSKSKDKYPTCSIQIIIDEKYATVFFDDSPYFSF